MELKFESNVVLLHIRMKKKVNGLFFIKQKSRTQFSMDKKWVGLKTYFINMRLFM